ncbi:heterokaryon incompatibility protein-domain-containing protein [Xylaria longipes]|nr:heterokaryon incompatibility protein-domain-containing protein [Xylaria longipes]
MFRSIEAHSRSKRQLLIWKNSMLLLLQLRDVKSGLAVRWYYFKTRYQDPYLTRSLMAEDRDNSFATTRIKGNSFGHHYLKASILPTLSLSVIQDRLRAHLKTTIPGSVIVLLNAFLPFAIIAFMILYTLEQEFKVEVLDRLGVWLVVSDITGEHRPLGMDQPRKQGSPAHPVIENDEIRLLILEPGRGNASLECRLVRCRVSNDTWYEALSYAWGNTPSRHMMRCNGEMMSITENLESALRHIRHPFARRVLWVDAICIDQEDDEERGHQVRLMSQIFSQAERVIVWLGEQTSDVKGAFSVRSSQGYFLGPEGIALTMPERKPRPSTLDFTMDNAAVSLSDGDLLPLVRLLERPWFRRLWVLQEAALAKAVILHCGKKRVRWDEFSDTLNQLKRKGFVFDSFTPEAAMGVEAVLEIEKIRSGSQPSLLCVLLGTFSAECRELKDKVYGVLSLARDYNPRMQDSPDETGMAVLEPDYTISTSEAFLRLATWGIQVYGAPDVLSCASRTDIEPLSELQGLPSWVPDWTRLDNNMPFARYEFCHISQQGALFVCDEPVLLRGLNLEIPALHIDSVAQVGCRSQFKKTPFGKLWEEEDEEPSKVVLRIHKWTDETASAMHAALAWIYDCERLASSTRMGQPSPGHDSRQIWKTLTAGMNSKGQATSQDFDQYFQIYRDFLEACVSVRDLGGSDMVVPRSRIDIVGQVEAALHMWSSKRRFATTENGFTVLVPNQTLEGDIVVIVANSRVPHILRPRSDGSYAVLGEAYLGNIHDSGLLEKEIHKGSTETAKYFRLV